MIPVTIKSSISTSASRGEQTSSEKDLSYYAGLCYLLFMLIVAPIIITLTIFRDYFEPGVLVSAPIIIMHAMRRRYDSRKNLHKAILGVLALILFFGLVNQTRLFLYSELTGLAAVAVSFLHLGAYFLYRTWIITYMTNVHASESTSPNEEAVDYKESRRFMQRKKPSLPWTIRNASKFRIWWDFENISLSSRKIRQLMNSIPGYIQSGYAFADPRTVSNSQEKALYDAKVPIMSVPDNKKQASDKVMRTRMRDVHRKEDVVEVVITSDGDFADLVRRWKNWGTYVWIITGRNFSKKLARNASFHCRVSDLIGYAST